MTFLFTDIEGSTRLWEVDRASMAAAVEQHDRILRAAIDGHGGVIFATGGDGFAVVFERAADALACALEAQHALTGGELLRVRMGVHTGEALERGGDFFGPTVNRAARLMSIGHGGQVLVSAATREVAGDGVLLVDLGEHRLRDLSRPERVFQLQLPGVNGDFPPLRSLSVVPTNLPVELTTFVGRDTEVEKLRGLVSADRLVTIVGVGGVGKTRLATRVAAELSDDFADGVWLCELAAADDRMALLEVVAGAIGVQRQDADGLDRVVEHLRPRRALVVLDNCEHLLDDVAELANSVLRRCPSIHLLVTSREGLGVDGEHVRPLRSLDADAAIALFADRAEAVAAPFTLDAKTHAVVAEICRRLDGIPLAIELAAARVGGMRPSEIALLLDERFRLLVGRRGRGVERHQTLRATVDWSYSLLGERDRVVFDRLGVFPATFDVAAAVAVAADDAIDRLDVVDALSELVAKSMIALDEGDERVSRYRLLETMRQYALEALDRRAEVDGCRHRHAEHYAAFAETAGPHLVGRDELAWRARVRSEIDNLRAAVGWALDRPDRADVEFAMRIIAALVFEVVGFRGSGLGQWGERAVAVRSANDSPRRGRVLIAAAYGAFHRLDLATARTHAEEAAATTSIDDPGTFALAQALLGNIIGSLEALEPAILLDLDALDALTQAGHTGWERLALVPAPLFLVLNGDTERACALADDLLAHARTLGWPTGMAMAEYTVAFTHQWVDLARALNACDHSLALTEQGASDVVYGHTYIVRGSVLHRTGRYAQAAADFADAISYSRAIGDDVEVMSAVAATVPLLVDVARPELAITTHRAWSRTVADLNWAALSGDTQDELDNAVSRAITALDEHTRQQATQLGTLTTWDDMIDTLLAELVTISNA